VHDIVDPLAEVRDVDVIISWQVLEHVSSLPRALSNLHAMLRPGGMLLAQTSGSFAAFAIAARVMPHRVRVKVMARYLGHQEDEKFPTSFDHCTAHAIRKLLNQWGPAEIVPFYRGAPYFSMSRPLQRLYLSYEGFVAARQWDNLATHYLLIASA